MTTSSDRPERTAENTKRPPSKYLPRPESPEYPPIIEALSRIKTCCVRPAQQTPNYLSELSSTSDPVALREAQSRHQPFLLWLKDKYNDNAPFYNLINDMVSHYSGLFEKAVMEAPDVTNETILEQLCDIMAKDL